MASHEEFVAEFVNSALQRSNIAEPSKQEMAQNFQQLLSSYSLSYPYEDRKSKRTLVDIAQNPPQHVESFQLDIHELEKVLVLQPLSKTDIQSHQVHNATPFQMPTHDPSQYHFEPSTTGSIPAPKKVRRSRGTISNTSSYIPAVGSASTSSIYSSTTYTAPPPLAPYTVNPLLDLPTPVDPSPQQPATSYTNVSNTVASKIPLSLSLPPSLVNGDFDTVVFPKMKSVFTYFWELDLSESGPHLLPSVAVQLNGAFFGRITENNYKDFGMELYHPGFVNLLFIKDKMDSRAYFNLQDFVYDFEAMFAHLRESYADDHPVSTKCTELRNIFRDKIRN